MKNYSCYNALLRNFLVSDVKAIRIDIWFGHLISHSVSLLISGKKYGKNSLHQCIYYSLLWNFKLKIQTSTNREIDNIQQFT